MRALETSPEILNSFRNISGAASPEIPGSFSIVIGRAFQSKFEISWLHTSTSQTNASNTELIGNTLYSDYVLPFELASVVLLIAIVSAIALTLRDRKDSKKTNPADQIAVKRKDRVRLVQMKSEEKFVKPKAKERT